MATAAKHVQLLLIHELVKYYLARSLRKRSSSPQSAEPQSQSSDGHASVKAALDLHGYYLGARIATRLTLGKGRIWDQNTCVIFVCKNVWTYLFGTNAGRLQSNSQGTYIIMCDQIPWLSHLGARAPVAGGSDGLGFSEDYKLFYLHLLAGIVRGCLAALGLSATVSPHMDDTYKFKVSLQG
ncbi:TRAFFICKING PROTEIN PARTICLE COMPLEX SUBUNIT 6B, putative [Babesia bigemina]|uniref:TRAFFICKING PROTEIN PARTICLE COMPLEX SUBUNIT 6B, putative n=1 Tax=Babesia bigemina TaxID=5866 RepID=A0A061DCS6_BABBI|nr:TRAFFICKING PROTEIN PARTICLE COMPLEX SUBUNIT 6B, putative [Babesia bigemina]CDR96859.1 TRAFFICKING PROTEIN PARTICLE COMPLEX SUBUNIT 6B, putative [Babesia bigemina]|eukprot:XP_012769045.1 TRAFFICKING PROTEIN PARTICLE COMPLEX SUBUNIT 6B, putative [Babesia bigemina]